MWLALANGALKNMTQAEAWKMWARVSFAAFGTQLPYEEAWASLIEMQGPANCTNKEKEARPSVPPGCSRASR